MSYVKEISLSTKKHLSDEGKKKASELIEKQRKEDNKMVKGIFKNLEAPGGDVQFAFRMYKGDPARVYHFVDGQEYEIPIGVAKHINRTCKYSRKKYSNILTKDSGGNWSQIPDKPIERYQFVSHEFM